MAEDQKVVDSTADEVLTADAVNPAGGEPAPELAEAVDPLMPTAAELAVVDPSDQHEVMLRMDDHDVRMLLEQVQSSALRKWVYELKQGNDPSKWPRGLTVHAVQDIVQRMNWSGKCRIGLLLDANGRPVLDVETITADAGNGPEPFWVATAYARDDVTGQVLPGASMEPHRMRLKPWTADNKRKAGAQIPEDNTVFDVFSRTKAIQKAARNALAGFIPEEVEQTVIAMFSADPSRVERIQTETEQKLAELPPALDDEKARELNARAQAIYDEIRDLNGGQGKVLLPPGQYAAWKLQAQHSHELLSNLCDYLEKRRDEIAGAAA